MLPPHRFTAITLILLLALSALALATSLAPTAAAQSQGGVVPVHMNLKAGDVLSPQTDDKEWEKDQPPRSYTSNPPFDSSRTREWKTIGTWTSNGNLYDMSIEGPVKFNLWWQEDDTSNYDAQVRYRWTLEVDDSTKIASHEDDSDQPECQRADDDPCEYSSQANLANMSTLPKGTQLSLTLEYEAFEDIYIYYDNITVDSGVTIKADAVYFHAGSSGSGKTILEFSEAWNTDVKVSLDNNFIQLIGSDGTPLVDNEDVLQADGNEYTFNNATLTAKRLTWPAGADGVALHYSYAPNQSKYAEVLTVEPQALGGIGGSSSADDDGGLPGLGFSGAVVALAAATVLVAGRRRTRPPS